MIKKLIVGLVLLGNIAMAQAYNVDITDSFGDDTGEIGVKIVDDSTNAEVQINQSDNGKIVVSLSRYPIGFWLDNTLAYMKVDKGHIYHSTSVNVDGGYYVWIFKDEKEFMEKIGDDMKIGKTLKFNLREESYRFNLKNSNHSISKFIRSL